MSTPTSTDLTFVCKCGKIAGKIAQATPQQGDHIVCHCTDCRNLVRYLGQEERVLDDHGGTALYQSRCARLRFDHGKEHLACLHMTDGKTLRWYADCCNSPLFNTYANGRIPYISTVLANCDPAQRALLLGEPLGHLFTHEATGDASALPKLSMGSFMRRFFKRMIKDIVSGDRRRNELFDAQSLIPIATPYRLTVAERQAIEQN